MNFNDLRIKYPVFIYDSYAIDEDINNLTITYSFKIPGLMDFSPKMVIPKKSITNNKIDTSFRDNIIFHIGLIEMISYYKCCCPPKIVINCGNLDKEQEIFLKKIFYYGLGEFFYVNGISISLDDLFEIECLGNNYSNCDSDYIGSGNLIPVGGGKDSCVSLELLKDLDSYPIIQNPKDVQLGCVKASGIDTSKIITFERTIERDKFKELANEGYLNGHTPFSALLAFQLYLMAYLSNKKYIVLSNENSANEGTVLGTKTNHQYSKSFEFERDFVNYTDRYLKADIHYFSILRPLSEYQIGILFSNYSKYHSIFRSCNVGSKNNPWIWCNHCAKCLFPFIILSPTLYKDKLIDIFGKDLYQDKSLLGILQELLGETGVKPFECVGEVSEIKYALAKTISVLDNDLPYLLRYFRDKYSNEIGDILKMDLEHEYNNENLIPKELEDILKRELDKYV